MSVRLFPHVNGELFTMINEQISDEEQKTELVYQGRYYDTYLSNVTRILFDNSNQNISYKKHF